MATETITFRPSKENSEMLNKLSELVKQDNRSLNNYLSDGKKKLLKLINSNELSI